MTDAQGQILGSASCIYDFLLWTFTNNHRGNYPPTRGLFYIIPPYYPHQSILISCLFPSSAQISQMGFAPCCESPTFSPGKPPGAKLIHDWVFQLENKGQGLKETRCPGEGRKPNTAPLLCKVLWVAPHSNSPAQPQTASDAE